MVMVAASAGGAAAVGKPAPAFMVDTLSGGTITADFHGKPAYINVFASWCTPCRGEIPRLVAAAHLYRGRIDFVFIDEQEAPARVQTFIHQFSVPDPVAIDEGQFAATYGLGSIPLSVFIDRNGVVRSIYRGPIPQRLLEQRLAELAGS
jgi:cytochrome c biogenesis protein CcmG, thiol:disulfide interchange protein DsbE